MCTLRIGSRSGLYCRATYSSFHCVGYNCVPLSSNKAVAEGSAGPKAIVLETQPGLSRTNQTSAPNGQLIALTKRTEPQAVFWSANWMLVPAGRPPIGHLR